MSMFDDVKNFHVQFGHPVAATPRFLDGERLEKRLRWQDDERAEFTEALFDDDLAKMADAMADQVYFILGTAVEMGIPFDLIFNEVHAANMRKMTKPHDPTCPSLNGDMEGFRRCTCGAVVYHADSKVMKPEGWTGPDNEISRLVREQDERR